MLCGAYMRQGSLVCFVVHACDGGAQYVLLCIHATEELSMICGAYMRRGSLVCFVLHTCDVGA